MSFELHPKLAPKRFVKDLPLCRILLQDEKNTPWLFLVPRQPGLLHIMDLPLQDQYQLTKELDLVQKVMWAEFKPQQLNVAALGNKILQLHIHVIARYADDPAWPNTVWDHPVRTKYESEQLNAVATRLESKLIL